MNKISVVGIGPGHRDYILPKASKIISQSDVIITGKRNLESIDGGHKITFIVENNLAQMIDFIKENRKDKKISVVVSGDTGFYSMLRYLKKHFSNEEIDVIAGLSSMQYMFSRLGQSWENAYLGSLHGRENDFVSKVKKYEKVGLLTDNKWTPDKIAFELMKNGINEKTMYVGENLSYENERIIKGSIKEFTEKKEYQICLVVISNE
ncbi:precorrin-6Y C5,15-methyltransferase (decarboxylating) [Proteiniborus ethanoligenes]|uniref:Precorrin-6Y C5,15-methyltransferase (Decarboxylating) n=1 Tax=Proteiniborus ethanoligenes TaxID=415015 RepID=A0A1H3QJ51_9FIRM|nr:precorrin-6y C5,15-methyltransferase (decarboxylating) subunit CbiE [Proteiniborus ethanoligenes]SDZ13562.1 precorrin-6Y C5,15-methyltransferase (decarboxylating) [Proteiniborus ethanoligenes]